MEKKSLGEDAEDQAEAMEEVEASSVSSFTARPCCSLLQYVLRACAGCLLGLCGGGSPLGDPQPGTAAAADHPAPTAAQEDAVGGSKAAVSTNCSLPSFIVQLLGYWLPLGYLPYIIAFL